MPVTEPLPITEPNGAANWSSCGPEPVDGHQLVNECWLRCTLSSFGGRYRGANRAAVGSQWSMDYLCVVLPAALVPLLSNEPTLDLNHSPQVLFEQGRLVALAGNHKSIEVELEHLPEYLDQLLTEWVAPVFGCLAAASGVSVKVLWNNFVAVWDSLIERAMAGDGRRGTIEVAQRWEAAQRWLAEIRTARGKIRLRDLQYPIASPIPKQCPQWVVRKYCCLHYQLCDAGQPPVWCEACPKLRQLPLVEQAQYLTELRK